jgi:hypothetical protein
MLKPISPTSDPEREQKIAPTVIIEAMLDFSFDRSFLAAIGLLITLTIRSAFSP